MYKTTMPKQSYTFETRKLSETRELPVQQGSKAGCSGRAFTSCLANFTRHDTSVSYAFVLTSNNYTSLGLNYLILQPMTLEAITMRL